MNNVALASSSIVVWVTIGAVKATVILALAAVVTHCLHRRSAATRHMVWTASLAGAISLLLLPLFLPVWRVLPSPQVRTTFTRMTAGLSSNSKPPASWKMPANQTPGSLGASTPPAALSPHEQDKSAAQSRTTRPFAFPAVIDNWKMILSCLWLSGVLIMLARYAWSDWAMRRVWKRAAPVGPGTCTDLLRQITRQWRITRAVVLAESQDVELPVTYGITRPRIVLPADFPEWSSQRCEYVLRHELAHVRRWDAGTQLVSQFAAAVFWFHPLIWLACRQMRFERERACDDSVLASGAAASDYAGDLLAMVQSYGCCGEHPTALAMLRRSHFEGRLCALLDQGLRRDVLSRPEIVCGALIATLLVVPLAVVRGAYPQPAPAAVPQAHQSHGARPALTSTPAMQLAASPAPAKVTRRPAPIAAQARAAVNPGDDIFAFCNSDPHEQSSHSNSDRDDTTWSASGTIGDCRYELHAIGRIAFSDDATALERISPGGSLELSTTIRAETTNLLAQPANDGTITYRMNRNGMPVDFAREGKSWLASFLLTLDRRTAFAVHSRLPKLLREGGPGAVLDEAGRMQTSHAKTQYLAQLMQQATLGGDDLRRVVQLAGSPQADYSTGRVLAIVAQKLDLTDESTRDAFLQTGLSLPSEAERARILSAYLLRASPSREQSAAIIAATNSMKSDYQKGRILVSLATKQPPDGDLLSAYLTSAQSIQSEFERRRVLAAVGR